eukprot:CAMPEP_0202691722 /NCGR_PEP_ID=MMETSP1385-20130828/6356_1 /ASSEMBLY_ACC=CAM_ASM_000861 /TAXON_ID=933848 /ORGANISM="Elphidium margaritaceum" /LENGTH=1117 /DNA_ID=CAMNT_0049347167 /DNA_START=82 /DNA_END=3435 /DNA_ORIENTATION=-
MSMKLRELIREVRQCKSASAERAVIAKELACVRTAIKRQDQVQYRHRNVAKLMYCDMLGYPTHFGQMEVLKLLASKSFVEKRLGYLALMQLLDENTEVLMLSTQSLKQDMCHENPFIVGLALCAMGNIASADISRDLGRELEKLLKHNNPYIRKKALCTAIRVINRVPEMCEEYFKCGMATLEDSGQGHGPAVAAVQLLYAICMKRSKLNKKLKKYSPQIIGRLSSLLRASYDPDHDIGGVTDPFLQVFLLKLLRLASMGDKKLSEDVDSVLAQIATNTESNKNPGNSILYECVRTIMSIEKQSSLHVLAINILGRFLVNRDNNVRYVALNALCNVVSSNTDAIQRHRNTIVECLKDEDLTIRKRALDLIYALTNKKNIRSLVCDLLNFLTVSNTTASESFDLTSGNAMDASSSVSPSKHDDVPKLSKKELKKLSKKERKKYDKEQRAREERERQRARQAAQREREQQQQRERAASSPGSEDAKPVFIEASSLSQGELEFRQELASKICLVVEQFAPCRKWHIDTIIQVMATTTSTGFNREQEVICNLFILVSNSPTLQAYCTYKLFECISKLQLNSDPIRQFTAWLIGEYGDKLMDETECQEANDELLKDRNGDDDEDGVNASNRELLSPHVEIEQMTKNLGPFEAKSADEIISMLKYIAKHDKSTESTKGYALTALMKLRHRYELNDVDRDDKIDKIVELFQDDKQLEVQQRSVEYLAMYENTDATARNRILKPMPVPPIERLFESKSEEKGKDDEDEFGADMDSDSEPEKTKKRDGDSDDDDEDESDEEEESEEEEDEEEDESDEDEDEEDSDSSDSDDKRKKGKKSKKAKAKEKEKKKKEKEKEKGKGKKKKGKKSDAPSIPVLLGPDETLAAPSSNGPPAPVQSNVVSAAPVLLTNVDNNLNHNHLNNGSKVDDLLNFGSSSVPANNVPPPSNNGGGVDLLADLMGGFGGAGGSANNASVAKSPAEADPLSDILGVTSSSSPSQAAQVPSASAKSQPFEAYNNNGITATFNFVPAQQEGVCRVLGVFHNSNSYDVSDFSFMIATPKYLKIQLKPANGTQLLALSQNSVTQRFQLTNTLYGSKPFIIRIQVVYTANGQQVKDRSQVQFPDNCC